MADVLPIISYDEETKTVCHKLCTLRIKQSYSKEGTWVWNGDSSHHMIYYFRWGHVQKPENGDGMK